MKNRSDISIADFSPHLFWDVDKDKVDIEKNQEFLIPRTLEYGLMKDWELIKMLYGLDQIKSVSLKTRSLDDVTLSFLCTIFGLRKDEFRCYRLRQSNQHFWNY